MKDIFNEECHGILSAWLNCMQKSELGSVLVITKCSRSQFAQVLWQKLEMAKITGFIFFLKMFGICFDAGDPTVNRSFSVDRIF